MCIVVVCMHNIYDCTAFNYLFIVTVFQRDEKEDFMFILTHHMKIISQQIAFKLNRYLICMHLLLSTELPKQC